MQAAERISERVDHLEIDMSEASFAVMELAKLGELQTRAINDNANKLARQAWWNRAVVLFLLVVLARLVTACGGTPFESSNRPGSPLAGAQSSAGAQSAGASAGLSGGAGAGGVPEIPEAPGGAGGDVQAAGGAGGADVETGGAPTIHLPCDTTAWKPSAFASRPAEPPAAAVDGDTVSRWSSGEPRAEGQWFALELGAGVVLDQLELGTPAYPGDLPSSLELELDGKPVDAAATSPAPGLLVLTFEATAASSARLVLTSSAVSWWSIAELGGRCRQ